MGQVLHGGATTTAAMHSSSNVGCKGMVHHIFLRNDFGYFRFTLGTFRSIVSYFVGSSWQPLHFDWSLIMSGTTDKISGGANAAVGNVKQAVGKAVGSEQLQEEGIAQEAKGEAQKAVGNVKEAVTHGVNKVADVINKKL
jgi:uncharacterized protein YjbJ (UPF0337 family)